MVVHPLPVASAPLEPGRDAGHAALFRILADGRRHAFGELSAALSDAALPSLLAGLAALQSLGMAMQVEADAVQVPAFVPLDPASICGAIDAVRGTVAWDVQVAFDVGSTNSELLRQVKRWSGAHEPVLLAAEFQHAGRGRLGRVWTSAGGASITASFAIPIARDIARLDGVTLACGLAVHDVATSLGVPARLKWPNDLLVDDRKLAGILVEAHADAVATTLVIGVGINVTSVAARLASPSGLPPASLRQDRDALDRNRLIADIAVALEDHLAKFATDGFGAFAQRWNAADAFRDRRVVLESPPGPTVIGIARGVDDRGALLLDVDGTRRRIIAGDVSLRPVAEVP
jgi:BirA family biotin operon repressor/biotin-[acetyl-CoA-carboxylase] ligase